MFSGNLQSCRPRLQLTRHGTVESVLVNFLVNQAQLGIKQYVVALQVYTIPSALLVRRT